jgi:4-hydroxybenzoate polyprenyltransferase
MRPHQWIKNLFVLAPLVFSHSLLEPTLLGRALLGAFLFCMISSVVYIMNDVFDIEKDKAHPSKRNRPIAAGVLPIKTASVSALVIGIVALGVSWSLNLKFGLVVTSYMVLNALYSWKLKNIPFVDVFIIALGFLFRMLAGAFVIEVFISEWLFACTFLLALYLGLGKRKHEVLQAGSDGAKQRRVLDYYKLEHLNYSLLCVAGMTVAVYTAYCLSVSLPSQPFHPQRSPFESKWMPATIPFAVVGIFRFYTLIGKRESAESPTDRMISDIPFLANLLVWGGIIIMMIYLD